MPQAQLHGSVGHRTRLIEVCLKSQRNNVRAHYDLCPVVYANQGRCSPEIFDEQARRQFQNKLPDRNPFGTEESPVDFAQFDIFTKVRATFGIESRIRTDVSLDPRIAATHTMGHDPPRAHS